MNKLITTVAVLLAAPLSAQARDFNFAVLDDDTNVVTLTTGADQGLVLGAGYARMLSIADQPILVNGDFSLQWAEVDANDFKLRAGALVPIVGYGPWKVIGGLTSLVRGTENDVSRMINVGTDFAVIGGYYAPRWFAALEGGFDWQIATHIDHSDAYRMQVFMDARDGWYGNPGGTIRAGIQTGVSFQGNDIILRAGRLVDVGGEPPLFPWYATLGYGRRW